MSPTQPSSLLYGELQIQTRVHENLDLRSDLSSSVSMLALTGVAQFVLILMLDVVICGPVATKASSYGNLTNIIPTPLYQGDPRRPPASAPTIYSYSDDGEHHCRFKPRRLIRSSRIPTSYELMPLISDAFSFAYNVVSWMGQDTWSNMPAYAFLSNDHRIRMSFDYASGHVIRVEVGGLELCVRKLVVWAHNYEFSNSDFEYWVDEEGGSTLTGIGQITFT